MKEGAHREPQHWVEDRGLAWLASFTASLSESSAWLTISYACGSVNELEEAASFRGNHPSWPLSSSSGYLLT